MDRNPGLTVRDVAALLVLYGFEMDEDAPDTLFRHSDGRTTFVAGEPDDPVPPDVVRRVARDVAMSVEEFLENR